MMKELMPEGNSAAIAYALCDRKFVVDGNIRFRHVGGAGESRANFGYFSYLRHMRGHMTQFLDDFRVSAVEHSKERSTFRSE